MRESVTRPLSRGRRLRVDVRPRRPHTPRRVRLPRTLIGALPLAGVAAVVGVAAVAAGPAAEPAAARPAVDPDPGTLLLRVRLHERVRLHRRPGGRVVAVLGARTELGSPPGLPRPAPPGAWGPVAAALPRGR